MVDRETPLSWTPDYVDYGQIKWDEDPVSTFRFGFGLGLEGNDVGLFGTPLCGPWFLVFLCPDLF